MPKYPFSAIVENIKDKRMPMPEDQYSYIGLEHLDSGRFVVSRQGSPAALKGSKLIMKQGDILFGKRNAYLRRVAIAPHDGLFSAHGMIFRPKKAIDPSFAPFFLRSDKFMQTAIDISVGSISPTVNWSDLKDIQFDLPPLSRQKELAKVLWAIEKTVERYESLLSKCDELVKSRFIEMFGEIGNTRFPIMCIEDLCDFVKDGTHQTPTYTDDHTSGFKFLSSKDVTAGKINWPNIKYIPKELHEVLYKAIKPQRNDILLAKNGTTGIAAIVDNDEIFDIYVSLALLRFKHAYNPKYMLHAINNDNTKKQFDASLKGIGVPNLHLGEIRKTKLIVPPIDLQNVFVDQVEQIDKLKFVSRINSRFLRNGMLCRRHRCL